LDFAFPSGYSDTGKSFMSTATNCSMYGGQKIAADDDVNDMISCSETDLISGVTDLDDLLNGTDLNDMLDCEEFTDFSDLLLVRIASVLPLDSDIF